MFGANSHLAGTMAATVTISIDVMGGDTGPEMAIGGAEISLIRHPNIRYELFGEKDVVEPVLEKYPRVKAVSNFEHCDVSIAMDAKPSQALRRGRKVSSMWKAVEAIKNGSSDVAISAGNTGALMAMSKFCLRMMAGIERPAIAAIWPTLQGESIVLDVGATIGADAQQLIDFSLMGSAMARALFDLNNPTIGLLNIGVEEVKGLDEIKTAGAMLRELTLPGFNYHGFVEGDDLGKGTVDVVVTEGFTGNIALKSAEGTAKQIGEYLKAAMNRTLIARIGYLFAKQAFDRLSDKMDPRKVNGGVFLGMNGVVIKSHGGTDAEGFAAAIDLGYDMVRNELLKKISHDLENYEQTRPVAEQPSTES